MLQEVIKFLIENPDIFHKVKEGTVSLIGINEEELKAIIDVLTSSPIRNSEYWN